jgi:hypothetical protein
MTGGQLGSGSPFYEGDGHKIIRRGSDVVDSPIGIVLSQQLGDTVRPVSLRIFTIVPIEKLNFIVHRLLLVIDSDIDLNVLFAFSPRNGYSDIAHNP